MVEPLPCREIVRVAIGGARQRSARTERGQPMFGAERIEVERQNGSRQKDPGKARKGGRKQIVTLHHGCTRLAGEPDNAVGG